VARRSLPKGLWGAALVPAMFNTVSQAVFCWTFYKIDPGLATFGLRSNIVFATIGAAILFAAERRVIRTPGYITGILLVVGGTVGTMLLGQGLPRGATLVGIVLAICSGAGFAGYALAVRHWMHGVSAIQSFAAISLYTAIGTVGVMLVLGDRGGLTALELLEKPCVLWGAPTVQGDGRVVLPGGQFSLLLISAVIGIALGHVFYYYSISRLGLAVAAGVVQLQPFFVSLGSLMLFGETLTVPQWVCGSVAVGGAVMILIVQHLMKRAEVAARHEPEVKEFAELPPDHVGAAVVGETEDSPRGHRGGGFTTETPRHRGDRNR